jgi:hypothetical protein
MSTSSEPLPGSIYIQGTGITSEGGDKAEIELALSRRPYPDDPQLSFLPLRVPELCQLILRGPLLRSSLQRASGRFQLYFNPGTYQIGLGEGEPCEIALREGAQVFARVEVGAGSAGPVVRAFDLHFKPALVINNLLQTLKQIHELVDDRLLAHLKPFGPRLPGWLRELGGLALGSTDATATILLEHVSGRPTFGPVPLLQMCFSGRVRWLDQLEVPFERVHLPSAVLPVPHAALDQLLSDQPLASASVAGALPEPWELARTLSATVQRVEGDVVADLAPPPLRVRTSTIDGIDLQGTVRVDGAVRVKVEVEGDVRAEAGGDAVALDLRTRQLQITPTDSAAGLDGAVEASVRLDLTTPGPGEPSPKLAQRARVTATAELEEGGRLPDLELELQVNESLCSGETRIPLRVERAELSAAVGLTTDSEGIRLWPAGPVALSGALTNSSTPIVVRRAQLELSGSLQESSFSGRLTPQLDGRWVVDLELLAQASAALRSHVTGVPELNLHDGDLEAHLDGALKLGLEVEIGPRQPLYSVNLSGSRFRWQAERVELELDDRRITLPSDTVVTGDIVCGGLHARGHDPFAINLRWDMHGQPCLLHHEGRAVSLLSPELRSGNLVLHLDEAGKLAFSGQKEGFYGVRYFKALLNPASDPAYIQELLKSDDAVAHVVAGLNAFNPELAELLTDLQALLRAAQTILDREGLVEPGDFIPRETMARVFSLLVTGDDGLQGQLTPIIKRATEGGGLDLATTKALLRQELGEFDIDYEIGFVINWLDLVLSPTEKQEPASATEELPLAIDPAFDDQRAGLPSAAEIYARVSEGQLDEAFARTLCELAPRLTLDQLGFILERASAGWDAAVQMRLHHVYAVKRRAEQVGQGYGGVEYALQPLVISGFLGEAVGPLPGINAPAGRDPDPAAWPPPCALGPQDVALLLMAGLAASRQDGRTQLNNRLLLERLRREPPSYTQEVLVELGHQSPRALSGILYAFLAQDQDQLAEPIDLVAFMEQKLGVPVPRQEDYLAGGKKARHSYYEALSKLADQIIEEAPPYLARRQHLQVVRQPPPQLLGLTAGSDAERLERRARESIVRADELAQQCRFDGQGRGGPRARSREAYRRAFRACARLLQAEPRAFALPWFKAFWQRNEEALKVLSVVRNYQQDLDDVRRWLRVQCGRTAFTDEQDLLRTTVRTCYWQEAHRQALLADPLLRLLIDPEPEGRYDFTIVSAMGVITEGAAGAELEHAYARLEQRRGVRIMRTHTATARSLEYNAARIIEAIEACETPYGLIGYSQGCANVLMAESTMLGGTPAQQRLADGLICRNLLFSAANGSAHGTCGMLKFRRAMDLGERYLKHYQALYSHEAVEAVLDLFKGVLDSKPFVAALGGADSLTFERARALHRDEQFLDRVPTSYTRGVTSIEALPEMLEFMYYMIREQIAGAGSVDQDTQVLITDAVGHATRVRNAHTVVLERCDMGSYPQATHHWAPLTKEVEVITTARDLRRAAYMSPKDRLVWPWVEVNARFGRIKST